MCARTVKVRPCARAAVPAGLRNEIRFGRFFEGKKSLKGSAMLPSWQHCTSPFLQLRVGPWVKQKICAALIAL